MIQISNADYASVKRLLSTFTRCNGRNARERDGMRRALLLLRKWERREKRSVLKEKSKDE